MITVFLLLLVFQIKHFLADYPLQTGYMLGKFKPSPDHFFPLLSHSAVHGALTFFICYVFTSALILPLVLGLIDTGIHFAADRLKASPKLFGKYKALTKSEFANATAKQRRGNKYFWWALGFDQMLHHLTHYAVIITLIGLS